VLVFSAIPFTVVKALANSPLGARLRRRLEDRKAAAVAETDALRAAARDARNNRCHPIAASLTGEQQHFICL
jgi:light-harvesting complex II chlorophyll a/b binding protein 7